MPGDIELVLAQMDGQVTGHADTQSDRENEEEVSLLKPLLVLEIIGVGHATGAVSFMKQYRKH